MDKRKWRRERNRVVLLAKLMEETGEVAEALLEKTAKQVAAECDHVVFIATRLKEEVLSGKTAQSRG